ncbi:hypothetical protein [Streptomyces sp. MA5143a]|uniref:hypothetical protein n=1 Tax=Streptomyces sp. MA5143a TaxID=2083010 RepID=UPI0011B25094|nr:hypothetical protein [Streptomyces sp. MA5143a]
MAGEAGEVDVGVQGDGLVGPVVGVAKRAASEVEQVEAVGGGGVSGADGELPPPLGAVAGVGEAEQAGEVQGAVAVGGRFSEFRQVCGSVVAVEGFSGQGLGALSARSSMVGKRPSGAGRCRT